MIRNEDDLVKYLVSHCKQIERIENSAKGGTPDTVIPCYSGWFWFELKILHGKELIFQNTQMAFFVKNRRLPKHLWAGVIVAKVNTLEGFVVSGDQILSWPKRPYAKGKTAVTVPEDMRMTGLRQLIDKMGVYIDIPS